MTAETIAKIKAQLQEIETQLIGLDLKNDFKKVIKEDLDLAVSYLKDQNLLGVINCLSVIVGKLHSYVLAAHCSGVSVEQFLFCIHRLLQVLIKCPVVITGPTGATGPVGPEGKPGPKGATGATGPAGKDGAVGGIGATGATGPVGPEGKPGPKGAIGATGPAGSPGPEGPMGATGPVGPTHIISSRTISICDYPVGKQEPVKPKYFDGGIHYQFICKPENPFHK